MENPVSDLLLAQQTENCKCFFVFFWIFLYTYVRKSTRGGALRAISRLAAPLLQSRTEVRFLAYSPQNATLPRTASADGNKRYRIAVRVVTGPGGEDYADFVKADVFSSRPL